MMSEQVINLLRDSVIAIDGEDVITDDTQLNIGKNSIGTSISATIDLWDLISNSHVGPFTGITMTYQADVDHWTIDVADLIDGINGLLDRRKYVAYVSSSDYTMRSFKITEFCVDDDSFEATLMRLPYQVEIDGGEAWLRWYPTEADFGTPANALYKSPAYEGGVGTTYATDPARVTHRGAVVENS